MAKITQIHKDCISCGACVSICPDCWEFGEDNKAKPKNGKLDEKTGNYEAEIKDTACSKDAVEVCPVQAIKILD